MVKCEAWLRLYFCYHNMLCAKYNACCIHTPKVWVSAAAAAYRYDETGTYQYHHTDTRVGLNLARGLDVYGQYVFGHTNVDNVALVGARYAF